MNTLPLQKARPGDVLATDLTTPEGVFALGKGATLSASVLARLDKMGVASVTIRSRSDDDSAAAMNTALAQLAARFAGCETDPILAEIRRVAEDHVRLRFE